MPLRIDASTIQRSPSTVTITDPWFGPTAPGDDNIVAIARATSNPSASSRSWRAPFPDQQVPPVPCSSQEAKKLSADEPGSGHDRPSARWISLSVLSKGTSPHHAA